MSLIKGSFFREEVIQKQLNYQYGEILTPFEIPKSVFVYFGFGLVLLLLSGIFIYVF